jgi:signal peptidase II
MLNYICLRIAAVLVALDQLVKFWAEHSLSQVDTIALIPGVFHLTYVQNFGAAFNTMNNQRLLLVVLTSAVLLVIFVLLLLGKLRSPWMVVSWSLILAGGAGNLIDRLFREGGYVVDLFDFRLINFPVFNVADICVTVGMALFLIYFIFIERKEHRRFEIRQEIKRHEQ